MRMGEIANSIHIIQRKHPPATEVVRILHTDQFCHRIVLIVTADIGLNLCQIKGAIWLVRNHHGVDTAKCRRAPLLRPEDVAAVTQNHLIPAATMGQYGSEIPHCATRDKNRCLFTQQLSHHCF